MVRLAPLDGECPVKLFHQHNQGQFVLQGHGGQGPNFVRRRADQGVAQQGATLTEAEFEQNGLVTDVGLAQLRSYLSEVPPERFKTPTKVKDIPRLFTTETFCKLVVAAQRETKAAG